MDEVDKKLTERIEMLLLDINEPYLGIDISLAACLLLELFQTVLEEREKKAVKYHQIMGATDWLKNRYGLQDDDLLNAGEVEELLQDFIDESLIPSSQGIKLGIHGNSCPHCMYDNCECHCKVCRPDLVSSQEEKE